ncbi:MAG: aminopeptidase P family protein [Tyzzerella sp.]|nr:aminopeptidase P family protein [Tyzzerella sp.]
MNITERIAELRRLMSEKGIDAYMIPSADFHQSEYTGAYFKSRAFITGFTGSAGTAVITQDTAGLWTDGRYFIQAEKQLAGTGITLYKMGNPGIPTLEEFLESTLPQNGTLGFDGRAVSVQTGNELAKLLSYKNIRIEYAYDLVDLIWTDRPALSDYPVFLLDEKYTGESTASKLERVRKVMKESGATAHILITLDDIAWLLNFRGRDVAYTPVVLSYAVVMMDCVHLFMNKLKLSDEIKSVLAKDGVILHPYNDVYEFVKGIDASEVLLIDPVRLNFALRSNIPANVKVIEKQNPCILMKAMKNEVEIENIKTAHVKDAVAHARFLYWLKNTIGKEPITEISASDKLESFRAEQEGFLWPSFGPISAFGAHAAMCHYGATPETDCELEMGQLYLSDTGGNYNEGSTDITRTYALGEVSDELKRDYTLVLKGNLALSRARFLYGCTGQNLDVLARQYLWNEDMDYNHGTGHGVGYLLSIHENGARFNWKYIEESARPLENGMVITDEPGVYIENSHGIRIENELLVHKGNKNDFGQFMYLEPITYVPIDLDAVDVSLLRDDEKAYLNDYHKNVYELLSPYLNDEEKEFLKHYTREI